MTRISKSPPRAASTFPQPGHWLLQDAKARFSELVRRVRSEGPQHVTVHGRDEVVVISAEEFRRLKGDVSGEVLIAAMQASPYRDMDIEPERGPMPVRDMALLRSGCSIPMFCLNCAAPSPRPRSWPSSHRSRSSGSASAP